MDITIIGKDIQIDSVETLAVENDNSTETIVFVLDKFQNGMDLSLLNPFVIYSNIYGVRSEILTKRVIEEKIYIEWILTRAVTCVNGRFDFCITFISSDDYNDISSDVKVWSTNIAHTKISGSLVGEEYAVPEEPIIVQMMQIANQVTIMEQNSRENADHADAAAKKVEATSERLDSIEQKLNQAERIIEEVNTKITTVDELIKSISGTVDQINGEVI